MSDMSQVFHAFFKTPETVSLLCWSVLSVAGLICSVCALVRPGAWRHALWLLPMTLGAGLLFRGFAFQLPPVWQAGAFLWAVGFLALAGVVVRTGNHSRGRGAA